MKKHKRVLSLALALVMVLSLLPTAALAVDTSGAVSSAQAEATLESTYGVNIQIDDGYSEEWRLGFLDNLEFILQALPAKLRGAVNSYLAGRNKKLTFHFIWDWSETRIAEGTYYNGTINIYPDGCDSETIAHEYGHLVHEMLEANVGANVLQKAWTAYNNGVAYGGGNQDTDDGPVFFSDYAASKYGEDFAETFSSMIDVPHEPKTYGIKVFTLRYPNCQAIMKMNYLRQLLCENYSINSAEFPNTNPSMPSDWAKADIAEYQNLLRPTFGVAADYEAGRYGVVPNSWFPHDKSYQEGATRIRFAYSIYHELIKALKPQYEGNPSGTIVYLSKEDAQKWYRTSEWLDDVKNGKVTVFTDVMDLQVGSTVQNSPLAVYMLSRNGVIEGTSATTFSPEKTLTRQEAATILYRLCNALNYELPQGELTFADAEDIAPWAQEAVAAMAASGIMGGVDGNRFAPTDVYTYEQCAVTLLRVYKLLTATVQQ